MTTIDYHSTIKMKPVDAWRQFWCADPNLEVINSKLQRLGLIERLRSNIQARGEAARELYLSKNPNLPAFAPGDIVLVRVPLNYRTSSLCIWKKSFGHR